MLSLPQQSVGNAVNMLHNTIAISANSGITIRTKVFTTAMIVVSAVSVRVSERISFTAG
jgi:hypothetical protein